MYEYIKGNIVDLSPAHVVVEAGSIGYYINITLQSYTLLQGNAFGKLFIHSAIREDAHILYGFFHKKERELFRLLISVSGIGANTARMMLSSMNAAELQNTIRSGNVDLLKSIKGIGAKSAQRIIIDLKDKLTTEGENGEIFLKTDNTLQKEALSALEILGFSKKQAEKALADIVAKNPGIGVEDLIKMALKML